MRPGNMPSRLRPHLAHESSRPTRLDTEDDAADLVAKGVDPVAWIEPFVHCRMADHIALPALEIIAEIRAQGPADLKARPGLQKEDRILSSHALRRLVDPGRVDDDIAVQRVRIVVPLHPGSQHPVEAAPRLPREA